MTEKKYPLPPEAAHAAGQVICDYLRDLRIERRLSQFELAQRMGVDQETVSKMERFRFNFGLKHLLNWCYCLGANPFISALEDNPSDHERAMQQLGRRPDNLSKN